MLNKILISPSSHQPKAQIGGVSDSPTELSFNSHMYIQRHSPMSSNMKPVGMKTLLLGCPRVGGPNVGGLICKSIKKTGRWQLIPRVAEFPHSLSLDAS